MTGKISLEEKMNWWKGTLLNDDIIDTVKSEHQFTGSETDFKQSQQHQVATS